MREVQEVTHYGAGAEGAARVAFRGEGSLEAA